MTGDHLLEQTTKTKSNFMIIKQSDYVFNL